jgi:hypothetical protein
MLTYIPLIDVLTSFTLLLHNQDQECHLCTTTVAVQKLETGSSIDESEICRQVVNLIGLGVIPGTSTSAVSLH